MGATVSSGPALPELGPALGRLVLPAVPGDEADQFLAPVRLALVTGLLSAAGSARASLAAGDATGAREALGPAAWAGQWDRAAEAAAALVITRLDERFARAAAGARMPARRAARLRITDAEHRAIHARLGAGAGALLHAAAQLDGMDGPAWAAGVSATARRVEAAWAALRAAAERELAEWEPEIQEAAGWRRPTWPLWAVTASVLGLALWAGLVLGGYLPVPGPLRPVAEYLWSRM